MTELVTLTRPLARPCFQWLLPLVFAIGCGLGMVWPGQSGHLFGIGALAGVWACFLVAGDDPSAWLVPSLVGGVPVLWFLGRLLDGLRADLFLWLVAMFGCAGVAGYLLLQGHADFEEALEYHGSFLAYCVCAMQLGAYGATLLSLVLGASRGVDR